MNRIDQLLQEANDDAKPSAADLERVKRGLDAKLFGATVVGAALTTKTAVASKAATSIAPKATGTLLAWKWIGLAVVGVSAVGSVAMFRGGSHAPSAEKVETQTASQAAAHVVPQGTIAMETTPASSATSEEVHPAPVTPLVLDPSAPATASLTPKVIPPPRRTVAIAARTTIGQETAARDKERLAEETTLVREMGAALARGDHKGAMRLADDHERRFPTGLLRDEREATRSIAQCKMGLHNNQAIFERYVRAVTTQTSYTRVQEACVKPSP